MQADKVDGETYSERADLEPQDDNLLILGESGDVLEALTRVPELSDKYVGKVKCVYIDPPFNTAQTFANYEDNLEHSVWLTMMRDRLVHLKKLLSDDGSIWVHLDDVENHRMRVLMDEVFGAGNFVAEVVWQKTYSPRNDSKTISSNNDFILVYAKDKKALSINGIERTTSSNEKYGSPDADPRLWRSDNNTAPHSISKSGKQVRSVYGIRHPFTGEMLYPTQGRQWAFKRSRIFEALSEFADFKEVDPDLEARSVATGIPISDLDPEIKDLELVDQELAKSSATTRINAGAWPEFYPNANGFGRKTYRDSVRRDKAPETVWLLDEVGHTDGANKEIQALFPGASPFATPKPERLLERIIHIATNPGDIVLDVFVGSGTTAAVAQKMGRRWVACELVEDTFERFTRPRLEKVVRGEDMGGITVTKGERVDATDDGLPEGFSAEDAQKLTSLLNKAIKDDPELKKSADIKAVKELVKTTKTKDTINWRGGGGFDVARLSNPCFDVDVDLGIPVLTEEATGDVLIRSVAAHLGFYLTEEESYFHGRRGYTLLLVVEGVLDKEKVDEAISHLPDGHGIRFAATIFDEDIEGYVRSFQNGSRAVHVPFDLFPAPTHESDEE